MSKAIVHFLSLVPVRAEFIFDDVSLAIGTAFFFTDGDGTFLISNWHNFSGRNSITNNPLSNTGGLPNKVKCRLILDKEYIKWEDCMFDLCDSEGAPLWLQHPKDGRIVDVAALPIKLPKRFRRIAINHYKFTEMRVEISQDVFILGFPLGITGRKEFPVWKRGSIASEPGGSYSRILVDTATRAGMSGAPVIMKYRGMYMTNPGSGFPSDDDWFGEGELFLGVYSGRLGKDEFQAQLGVVWKKEVIEEIIRGKTLAIL